MCTARPLTTPLHSLYIEEAPSNVHPGLTFASIPGFNRQLACFPFFERWDWVQLKCLTVTVVRNFLYTRGRKVRNVKDGSHRKQVATAAVHLIYAYTRFSCLFLCKLLFVKLWTDKVWEHLGWKACEVRVLESMIVSSQFPLPSAPTAA